jgi:hypothetical protein
VTPSWRADLQITAKAPVAFDATTDTWDARKLSVATGCPWPDVSGPIVGRVTCQFDRQVCGIEIVIA